MYRIHYLFTPYAAFIELFDKIRFDVFISEDGKQPDNGARGIRAIISRVWFRDNIKALHTRIECLNRKARCRNSSQVICIVSINPNTGITSNYLTIVILFDLEENKTLLRNRKVICIMHSNKTYKHIYPMKFIQLALCLNQVSS